MKTIPLTQGKFALVDDADYAEVSRFIWHAKKDPHTFYAARQIAVGPYKQRLLRMHTHIIGTETPGKIDHKDGNGLNNQRYNLRRVTDLQNASNRRKSNVHTTSSRFKGVHWKMDSQKWIAYITFSRKRTFLGYFKNEVDAARAYDSAAQQFFGDFCSLNFPI